MKRLLLILLLTLAASALAAPILELGVAFDASQDRAGAHAYASLYGVEIVLRTIGEGEDATILSLLPSGSLFYGLAGDRGFGGEIAVEVVYDRPVFTISGRLAGGARPGGSFYLDGAIGILFSVGP